MKDLFKALAIAATLIVIMTVVLISTFEIENKDRYGNTFELTKKEVIMADGNILTVEELIEVYEELHH